MGLFIVVGVGSFGFNVATELTELGHEVLVIDSSGKKIEQIKDKVTQAVTADVKNREALSKIVSNDVDAAIVSLGDSMEASALTVLYLKESGVKRIIVKAMNDDHGKLLESMGATEIIYPEKDMAIKTALKLNSPNILEYFPFTSGIIIQEIAPPKKFISKSLKELDLINKYGIQVIAIKELVPEKVIFIPKADFIIKDSDILIMIGEKEQLAKINNK